MLLPSLDPLGQPLPQALGFGFPQPGLIHLPDLLVLFQRQETTVLRGVLSRQLYIGLEPVDQYLFAESGHARLCDPAEAFHLQLRP